MNLLEGHAVAEEVCVPFSVSFEGLLKALEEGDASWMTYESAILEQARRDALDSMTQNLSNAEIMGLQ